MEFYRIIALVLLILGLVVRKYYEAKVKNEEVKTRRHPVREQIFHILMWLSLLPMIVYIFSPLLDSFELGLSPIVRLGGAGASTAGIFLLWWSHYSLGRQWSPRLETREKHRLIVSGPYRWVRHPMYSSLILSGVGYLLLTSNWLAPLAYMAVLLTLTVIRMPVEDQMMGELFGDEYARYRKSTKYLIPKIL